MVVDDEHVSSRWLLQQLGRKLRHFPRDYSRRLRRSLRKRRGAPSLSGRLAALVPERLLEIKGTSGLFSLSEASAAAATDIRAAQDGGRVAAFDGLASYDELARIVAEAARLEPLVGTLTGHETVLVPHGHDKDYEAFCAVRALVPRGRFDAVVLMPAGRMGGADYVAALLARALSERQSVLILRTDDSDWDRPDWFPPEVPSVDLSGALKAVHDRTKALYVLLSEIGARDVFNVNSRLCFETFADYGMRLAVETRLHSYYFCADHTPEGLETGYPVWYFSGLFPCLTTSITDNDALRRTLVERFSIPEREAPKIRLVYTPAKTEVPGAPVAGTGREAMGAERRPRILWAGRLDRQKRFDLLTDIAAAMPDVDFLCWGKAVLDAPPNLSALPANVRMQGAFASFDDLPLGEAEGFLYTSAWDGLPTILIELGALGVPIVASAVGGVPELIDEACGWPVPGDAGRDAYVAALRELLASPEARIARAGALQRKVAARHGWAAYAGGLAGIVASDPVS